MKWQLTHLEVLDHHLRHGAVWDTHQIDLDARDSLIDLGMIERVRDNGPTGYCCITNTGSTFMLKNTWVFNLWSSIYNFPSNGRIKNWLLALVPKLIRSV